MTTISPSATGLNDQVRVFVFEATQMACDLLSHRLEESPYELKVIGTSFSFNDKAAFLLAEADVTVISSDLADGPQAGFILLRSLLRTNRSLRCVMLLDQGGPEQVVEAFRRGAVGVFKRNQSCEMLCKCVYRVSTGQVWADSQQLNYVVEALASGMAGRVTDAKGQFLLTPREDEICSMVADGLKNREIATLLKLSEHTVKNHLFKTFEKLGISSRTELILYVLGQRNNGFSGYPDSPQGPPS